MPQNAPSPYYESHDVAAELEASEWERHEGSGHQAAMSGFNTRLPTELLNDVRGLARARGMATGAWIREAIEAAVAREKTGDDLVPLSVLLAAATEYHHRKAS